MEHWEHLEQHMGHFHGLLHIIIWFVDKYDGFKKLCKCFIGFSSSVVSDTCSNSIRVLKTTRQTSETPISYLDAGKQIIKNDGILSLLEED